MLIYDITAEPLSEEYKKMVRQQRIMTKENIKMRHKNQILKKKKKTVGKTSQPFEETESWRQNSFAKCTEAAQTIKKKS